MRFVVIASVPMLVFIGAGASAHAFLDHADPAVGAQVASPPKLLRLWFTETIEPKFSKVELMAADGSPMATGPLALSPSDASELDLPLAGALAPGTYKVTWQVVSTDTHRTQGDFTFEVER